MSGFRSSTDKEIANGSAPFKYEYRPGDSQQCITSKSIYNNVTSDIFSSSNGTSNPFSSTVANYTVLGFAQRSIDKHCSSNIIKPKL